MLSGSWRYLALLVWRKTHEIEFGRRWRVQVPSVFRSNRKIGHLHEIVLFQGLVVLTTGFMPCGFSGIANYCHVFHFGRNNEGRWCRCMNLQQPLVISRAAQQVPSELTSRFHKPCVSQLAFVHRIARYDRTGRPPKHTG